MPAALPGPGPLPPSAKQHPCPCRAGPTPVAGKGGFDCATRKLVAPQSFQQQPESVAESDCSGTQGGTHGGTTAQDPNVAMQRMCDRGGTVRMWAKVHGRNPLLKQQAVYRLLGDFRVIARAACCHSFSIFFLSRFRS